MLKMAWPGPFAASPHILMHRALSASWNVEVPQCVFCTLAGISVQGLLFLAGQDAVLLSRALVDCGESALPKHAFLCQLLRMNEQVTQQLLHV